MPKTIPVANELTKPFWDAINEKRLTVQNCTSCNTMQYPPRPECQDCGSDKFEWKEVSGKGHILSYFITYDGRYQRRIPDQPYNVAIVSLDEDPRILADMIEAAAAAGQTDYAFTHLKRVAFRHPVLARGFLGHDSPGWRALKAHPDFQSWWNTQ